MKKTLLILLLFFLLPFSIFSQDTVAVGRIIAFHPSAGNSIDLKEKIEFGIFPEYSDSLFESAELLEYKGKTYGILIRSRNGKAFERVAERPELDAIYAAIEKVRPAAEPDYVERDPSIAAKEEKEKKQRHQEWADFFTESTVRTMVFLTEMTLYILVNLN